MCMNITDNLDGTFTTTFVPPNTGIQRFTAYRRAISGRDTHTAFQKNADHLAQFEGVIWSDGSVSLRWLTACKSTSVWASVADMLNIHGHPEYGTEIIWHDDREPAEWTAQVAAWRAAQADR
jgi:hypothetical protein